MNQMYAEPQNNFKGRKAVAILTLVALFCTVISCFTYFISVGMSDEGIDFVGHTPGAIELIEMIWNLLPVVLFTIYIFVFQSKGAASVLVNIIFSIIAISPIITIVEYVTHNYTFTAEVVVGFIVIATSFGLAAGFAQNVRYRRIFMLIATGIGIVDRIAACYDYAEFLDYLKIILGKDYVEYYYITHNMEALVIIGAVLLFVAMFIYGLNSKVPVRIVMPGYAPMYGGMPDPNMQYGGMQMPDPNMQYGAPQMQNPNMQYGGMQAPNNNMQAMPTPEQMLADLDNRMRNGMISPEEYYRRRDEILGGYGR